MYKSRYVTINNNTRIAMRRNQRVWQIRSIKKKKKIT